jgi:hypothetical protein
VTLASGTPITIRLLEPLSSEHSTTGDTFRGTLRSSIVRNGFIIAEKGARVTGKVLNATQAGHVAGVSQLSLALTEINTTDGQHVAIETTPVEKKSKSAGKSSAEKIGGGAAIGAIIGAIAGGGKGAAIGAGVGGAAGTGITYGGDKKVVSLPVETELVFDLSVPVTITERINRK